MTIRLAASKDASKMRAKLRRSTFPFDGRQAFAQRERAAPKEGFDPPCGARCALG